MTRPDCILRDCDHCLQTSWFVLIEKEGKFICAGRPKPRNGNPLQGCGRKLEWNELISKTGEPKA